MKDKNGYDYAELLAIQREHLAQWQPLLRPALFTEVKGYVLSTNHETFSTEEKHRVYRGQDLVEIIRTWPILSPAYEPRTAVETTAASLI